MSRAVSRRGRMRSQDELRIQLNTKFIEEEVDGRDLVASLFTAQILDANDKDEIQSGRTRLERTRRLIDTVLLRGPDAFDEFLHSLDGNGYDHVAFRLRNAIPEHSRTSLTDTDACTTCRNSLTSNDNVFLTSTSIPNDQIQVSGLLNKSISISKPVSMIYRDNTDLDDKILSSEFNTELVISNYSNNNNSNKSKSLDERLKKIEDSCFILSRRVTRVEDRVTASADLPEDEIYILKEELAEIKNDTLQQIYDLTSENEQKTAVIESLTQEVEDRKAKLAQAQERIESLEKRLVGLETDKARAEADVKLLKQRLEDNEKQIEEQHSHFLSESLRMRNQLLSQNKRLKDQGDALVELQKKELENEQRFVIQENDMHEQRLQMADQQQQLSLLVQVVHGMTQTGGTTGGLPGNANNLAFCVSGNSVNGPTERGSTVRSVKRSAAPSIYRGSRRK